MKIWFIEIGEPLPLEENARLLRYARLSAFLASKGHTVTWFASTFSHAKKAHLFTEDKEQNWQDVKLKLLHTSSGYKKNMSLNRIRHQMVYAKALKKALDIADKPDLIILPIPTLENAHVVTQYAHKNSIPYILDIRDNWPDEYIRWLPRWSQLIASLIVWPLEKILQNASAGATGIMGVSQLQLDYGIAHAGRAQCKKDKVFYLGYHQDNLAGHELENAKKWLSTKIQENRFTISFIGTMGSSRDLTSIIKITKQMNKAGKFIQFLIAGNGDHLQYYKELAADHPSIIFLGWVDKYRIDAIMQTSDLVIAPYRPDSNMSLPTKYFEYMAAGRPVLSSCVGEAKMLIEKHDIGYYYDLEDLTGLQKILHHCLENQDELQEKGARAQIIFKQHFSFDVLFPKIENYFCERLEAFHAQF